MKNSTSLQILSGLLLGIVFAGCASKSSLDPVGDNTYTITREAGNGFDRDTDKLKALVKEDAQKYCTSKGKELKVVDLTAERPFFSTGYAKARIVFKALTPGDPELTNAPLPMPMATPVTAPAGERLVAGGDLYNDLIKLDDLRKKGILTEAEFQSEKQKILNRSK